MKVEVARQDISDSAAMLKQLEIWEKFILIGNDAVLSLQTGKFEVKAIISHDGISRLEYSARGGHGDRIAYLELAIAKVCQQRSQELAKEVCELIRKAMPLPLETEVKK